MPLAAKSLIPIQLLLSVISIPSGILVLMSPSGLALGAQTILPLLRQKVPFVQDFTSVGLFLLVVYGILPIVFAYGLFKKIRWAWILTLLLGVTEIAWILAEVILFYDLGFFIFYPIIAGMGALTIVLCILPKVSSFYSRRSIDSPLAA